jgi:ribA/ribD-fused uncharacterized protein
MSDNVSIRTYSRADCVVFRKTKEDYGGLSNMASGFPLQINGTKIWSSEALYQACRFPYRPDVQKIILAERSPMTAKMRSKPFRAEFTRPDWDQIKVKIMRWCLRVKLAQNWEKFSTLLLSTGQKPIVEDSAKDDFWGAKKTDDGLLVGKNVLGRLLMELRQELTSPSTERLKTLPHPDIPDLMLLGKAIRFDSDTEARTASEPAESTTAEQESASHSLSLGTSIPKPDWPTVTQTELTSNVGVHLVGFAVTKELGFVFREKPVSDIGIDGEIEIREADKSHGRLIATQIKTGASYLKNRTRTGYVYRGSTTQLRYWLNYAVPVLLILCDPERRECWWQLIDLDKIQFHEGEAWSIEIPFANRLDSSAADDIRKIASRFQKRDILDLLFKHWLVESSYYQLVLANVLESPRDYHWISYLGRKQDQFIMADYVLADLATFRLEDIQEMIEWAESNHRDFGYDRLLLGLISETAAAFPFQYRPVVNERRLQVELVPLLFNMVGEPHLSEIGVGGRRIAGYYDGRTWDDWQGEVQTDRALITASDHAGGAHSSADE